MTLSEFPEWRGKCYGIDVFTWIPFLRAVGCQLIKSRRTTMSANYSRIMLSPQFGTFGFECGAFISVL